MKRDQDDKHLDKAKKRLMQFESAREPQMSDEDLIDGLDDLIAELVAKDESLAIRAADRLRQFRNKFFTQFGSQNPSNKKSEQK